jgi:hypothetical protein
MTAPKQNTNPELSRGTATEICGNITEAAVGGLTTGVGEIGRVTGRAAGEAVGGIVDGLVEAGTAITELIGGPRDPAEYKEWMTDRQQRKQDRAGMKAAAKTAKDLQPLQSAMAQFEAMREMTQQMGPPQQSQPPGLTASDIQVIVDRAVTAALSAVNNK